MVDVLAYIARTNLSEQQIQSFLRAIARAIQDVQRTPAKFKPFYLQILRETFGGYPSSQLTRVLRATESAEGRINVVQWGDLKPYAEGTFSTIKGWMTSHNLLESNITYGQLVNNSPLEHILRS